jgi:hypothetical protein
VLASPVGSISHYTFFAKYFLYRCISLLVPSPVYTSASNLTSLPWRWVRWEPLVCVPVRVLGWRQSVVDGPSSFRLLVVASSARWYRGGAWLTKGRVLHISVLDSSLLLLLVAPVCQPDSSGLPATRVLRLFMVVLDTASSQFRSRGVTSWVHVELLLCVRELLCLFHFFSSFFSLCLS